MTIKKILAIKSEIKAIAANDHNQGQGYKFRSYKTILNALKPLSDKHGVFFYGRLKKATMEDFKVLTQVQRKDGSFFDKERIDHRSIVEFEFVFGSEEGELIVGPYVGEGIDSGDKATSKASTQAMKTMLAQVFCIPFEDDVDGDAESPELHPTLSSIDSEIIAEIKRLGWTREDITGLLGSVYHVDRISLLKEEQKQHFLKQLKETKEN